MHEAGIVKDALAVKGEVTTFSPHLQQSLLSMFARYGCCNVPTPKNLMKLILDSARYEFVIKPCAAVNALRSGVPKQHNSFWDNMSVVQLWELCRALSANPSKVLALLDQATDSALLLCPNEERSQAVYRYNDL